MAPLVLLRLGMPVAMGISALVAWRVAKHDRGDGQPGWRDDSLDDWRRQVDAERERERLDRLRRHEDVPPDDASSDDVRRHP